MSWDPVLQNGLHSSKENLVVTIGHSLRACYDSILQQGVPMRFRSLIEMIERSEREAMRASKR
ncbi:NepR family anti-sigma factor [Microvirga arabica]